jgi:putative iron-dependent peroxidase
VAHPQIGIFALGTLAHAYLEFDGVEGADADAIVRAVAALDEPTTTMGGVNLVVGFRPEVWCAFAPEGAPPGLSGFDEPVVGPDGYTMPATQHDVVLWIAGGAYDIVFDAALRMISELAPVVTLACEVDGWAYHRDRDLTGFEDGTENPTVAEAPGVALVPDGSPGAGGSVLLLQQWVHDAPAWTSLPVEEQERVIGRTKADSLELDPKPTGSHAARTDQDDFGHIFRRNTAYGTVSDHGTVFVGFCAEQRPLATMLESMAGSEGTRDDLTRYSRPLTGAYYFVPSIDDLTAAAAVSGP